MNLGGYKNVLPKGKWSLSGFITGDQTEQWPVWRTWGSQVFSSEKMCLKWTETFYFLLTNSTGGYDRAEVKEGLRYTLALKAAIGRKSWGAELID